MSINNLTMSADASYDTTAPRFGTGALNSGNAYAPPSLFTGLTAYTVDCWIKRSEPSSSYDAIIGQWTYLGGYGSFLAVKNSVIALNYYYLYFDLEGTKNVCDGAWHHIRGVWSPSGCSISVDGVLDVSTPNTLLTYPVFSVGVGFIYNNYLGNTMQFFGEIDELAVFSTALPSTYTPQTSPYSGYESSLIALYHFDGNGNDSNESGSSTVFNPARITWTDRSGTIQTAGVPQQLMPANVNRNAWWILNSPDSQAELFVNFTNSAGVNTQSFRLQPGGTYQDPAGIVTIEAVFVYSSAVIQFYAKEC